MARPTLWYAENVSCMRMKVIGIYVFYDEMVHLVMNILIMMIFLILRGYLLLILDIVA